jgi:hypothetical protein
MLSSFHFFNYLLEAAYSGVLIVNARPQPDRGERTYLDFFEEDSQQRQLLIEKYCLSILGSFLDTELGSWSLNFEFSHCYRRGVSAAAVVAAPSPSLSPS